MIICVPLRTNSQQSFMSSFSVCSSAERTEFAGESVFLWQKTPFTDVWAPSNCGGGVGACAGHNKAWGFSIWVRSLPKSSSLVSSSLLFISPNQTTGLLVAPVLNLCLVI